MSVYCDVNTLEDVTFIAGSTQIFEYEIMNAQTGEYVDISGCELEFAQRPMYNPTAYDAIVKEATVKDEHTFRVALSPDDTIGLQGKYLQQVKIIDNYNSEQSIFKPAQGRVTIIQSIVDD